MSLSPEIKIAHERLSVLELAKALGNVSAACRQRGMLRSQFYEYKRRFQTHGIEGLVDLPPVPHSHPATTPAERQKWSSASWRSAWNILLGAVTG